MPRSNPLPLQFNTDTDSEDERLLRSIDLVNHARRTIPTNSREKRNAFDNNLSELNSLTSSPKRPRTQPYADNTSRIHGIALSDVKKRAQLSAREQKRALAEEKRQEKEHVRQEREAIKLAKKAERIRRAFSDAESRGTFRRNEVEVIVSPQLFADTTRNDVLSHVRALFPDQIVSSDLGIQNLVTWRRKDVEASSSHSPDRKDLEAKISLVVFPGSKYWDMMVSGNDVDGLFGRAQEVLSKRRGEEIFYVIYGVESECKRRTKNAVQLGAKEKIISMQAVQDSYAILFMKYGIRTHSFNRIIDAAKYILELTDAFADKPYYQQDDFLDATLKYRDARKKLLNRSTVISIPGIASLQENVDEYEETRVETAVDTEEGDKTNEYDGMVFVPFVRSEGREDLGYMYLSFLALIPRVTFETAKAIRQRYPTLYHLFRAYRSCTSLERKHSLLADLRCEPNNRRIGPALSKSIATILTSQDPSTAFRM